MAATSSHNDPVSAAHMAEIPELAAAWLSLGTACAKLADAGCARAAWQRARELDPGLVEALVQRETPTAPADR